MQRNDPPQGGQRHHRAQQGQPAGELGAAFGPFQGIAQRAGHGLAGRAIDFACQGGELPDFAVLLPDAHVFTAGEVRPGATIAAAGAAQGQKGADEQDKYVINIKQIAKFVVGLGDRVAPSDIEEGMRVG